MRLSKMKLAGLERGLLQVEISRLVGVSESLISKIETGRSIPEADVANKIARVLGTSADELWPDATLVSQSR